jgi:adenosine deaminase
MLVLKLVPCSLKSFRISFVAFFLISLAPFSWSQRKLGSPASAQQAPEQKTSRYFESIQNQPLLVHAFLQDMPKGGDLHNHLSGAVYAESFINYAVRDGLCVDRNTLSFLPSLCDPSSNKPPASVALQDPTLYGELLDAFSMRQFIPGAESGHDHFFATFGKFGAATNGHTADMLAEVRSRAAAGHLQYMELMFNPDGGAAGKLGSSLGKNEKLETNDDFSRFRDQLLSNGLPQIITDASKFLDDTEKQEQGIMHCGQPVSDAGCNVEARYLYQVSRGLAKEVVFAQILAGFEMASKDPRVVGLNLVMAEDWYVPIHDFDLHMKMLDYLHGVYPKVHITLHAGELTQNLVPPEDLYHIRASVELGHAERIGHGVDVMQEHDPQALLRLMAQKKVLVEICLTSNDVILNVTGTHHPLPIYLKFGVPVTLATDDEGVSRGDIVQEYTRAAETYHFKYQELKKFARASLEYSFLPGESIWKDANTGARATACLTDKASAASPSASCAKLLESSGKAKQEWALEKAFAQFESKF